MNQSVYSNDNPSTVANEATADSIETVKTPKPEVGGRNGPDPTRYGDWEKNGRCIDF